MRLFPLAADVAYEFDSPQSFQVIEKTVPPGVTSRGGCEHNTSFDAFGGLQRGGLNFQWLGKEKSYASYVEPLHGRPRSAHSAKTSRSKEAHSAPSSALWRKMLLTFDPNVSLKY